MTCLFRRLALAGALGSALGAAVASCATDGGAAAAAGRPAGEPAVRGTTPAGGESALRVGVASVPITPPVGPDAAPVRIAGYGEGRDATAVNDDLYARALVFDDGGEAVALVALDLIGFFHDDVLLIRDELRARHPEIPARLLVLVASTHTHAGPDVIGLWSPPERHVDPAYIARIRSAAAAAVAQAWEARRPARLSFARADLTGLVIDSRLPIVLDTTAMLLKADAADGGGTIATLLDVPSHPEAFGRANTLLSSDFPWAARLRLEKAFGGMAVYVSADIGGLMTPAGIEMKDPRDGRPLTPGAPRTTEAYGEAVADALIAAWRSAPDPAGGAAAGVRARRLDISVPLANARFRQGLEQGHIWPRRVSEEGTLASEVAVVTFGGGERAPSPGAGAARGGGQPIAQIACVPGEIYPELVNGGIQDPQEAGADFQGAPKEAPLRPMMSGRYRFVVGLCDDELGYVIPKSQWDLIAPFAYGRTGPQYGEINSTGPDAARAILDGFATLLKQP